MTDVQPKINIDGVEYLLDDLSDNAKAQIQNLQFVETEIARLNGQLAVAATARNTYQNSLKNELDSK